MKVNWRVVELGSILSRDMSNLRYRHLRKAALNCGRECLLLRYFTICLKLYLIIWHFKRWCSLLQNPCLVCWNGWCKWLHIDSFRDSLRVEWLTLVWALRTWNCSRYLMRLFESLFHVRHENSDWGRERTYNRCLYHFFSYLLNFIWDDLYFIL